VCCFSEDDVSQPLCLTGGDVHEPHGRFVPGQPAPAALVRVPAPAHKLHKHTTYLLYFNRSTTRLTTHLMIYNDTRFVTFAVGLPGPTSLLTIYQTFLDGAWSPRAAYILLCSIVLTQICM
jgi:hypothetical protein